jgi:Xaa-Pro aminopeptidase
MQDVFSERRRQVIQAMGQGTMLVFAAPVVERNPGVEYEYRQDSDFFYLTGLDEQESVLVLRAGSEPSFVLFVRPRDPERETWNGERIGVEGAVERFGAIQAYPLEELSTRLFELLKGQPRLYYALGRVPREDELVLGVLSRIRACARRGDAGPSSIVEPGTILHEMRLIKSSYEVERITRAIESTRAGHHALFERTRPGMGENELEGILTERFRALGAERYAYPSIVASGRNARVLHHRRNNRTMRSGELVLVDAGAEYEYLAADITRTFPVSGAFSPSQRQAYEIVLCAQEAAITAVRPGATLDDVHRAAVRVLCAGLIELGVLTGTVDELSDGDAFKKYYMHRTSHWLGMDVHDVGEHYVGGQPRPLEPGMVLTIEPGLYLSADDPAVPDGLKDVGIRIEDDVLVTADGCINLSASIAKTVDEIETIMRRGVSG